MVALEGYIFVTKKIEVFASEALPGELEDFPDIKRGWGTTKESTGGIPPMKWFNAIQKRTDEAINSVAEHSVNGYTFKEGATLESENDFIYDDNSKSWYFWIGENAKIITSGSVATDVIHSDGGLWSIDNPSGLWVELGYSGGDLQHLVDLIQRTRNAQRMQIPISDRKLIINAHRGYSETYFEQTILAFSQCRADAIEIDMQTTSDGVAVCFHDDDLSIQTTGKGAIKDNTIQQIRDCRYKRAQNTRYADMLSIPSLSAVCRVAARTGKKLLAEIKGYRTIDDCSQYNTIISTYGLAPTTTFICFDFSVLQYLHNINPSSSYGYVIASYEPYMDENINELISWGGGVVDIARDALPKVGMEKLRQWEANGLTIGVWTIYTMEQLNEALLYGIRHLTLDKDFADILNK